MENFGANLQQKIGATPPGLQGAARACEAGRLRTLALKSESIFGLALPTVETSPGVFLRVGKHRRRPGGANQR